MLTLGVKIYAVIPVMRVCIYRTLRDLILSRLIASGWYLFAGFARAEYSGNMDAAKLRRQARRSPRGCGRGVALCRAEVRQTQLPDSVAAVRQLSILGISALDSRLRKATSHSLVPIMLLLV